MNAKTCKLLRKLARLQYPNPETRYQRLNMPSRRYQLRLDPTCRAYYIRLVKREHNRPGTRAAHRTLNRQDLAYAIRHFGEDNL